MALFSRQDNFEQESQNADKEAISSIIDADMTVKGELIFQGKARIDGTIEGNIQGEHLILSECGNIIGDIQVATLVCHGTVDGNVRASLVTACKSCKIKGCIESKMLSVEPGAAIEGELKISSKELHLVDTDNAVQTATG